MKCTKEHLEAMLPIMEAWVKGKTIEYFDDSTEMWVEVNHQSAHWSVDYDYRIKPEKTPRPWKMEEVPIGALIRTKAGNCPYKALIISASEYQVCFGDHTYDFDEDDLNYFEHSVDGGKTWLPCGVMI